MSPNATALLRMRSLLLFQLTQQVFVVKIDKYYLQMLKNTLIVDDRDFGAEKLLANRGYRSIAAV